MKENKQRGQLSHQLTVFLFLILLINTVVAVAIGGYHFRNEYVSLMKSRAETVGGNLRTFMADILNLGLPIGALDGVEKELEKAVNGELRAIYANVVDPEGNILYSVPAATESALFHPEVVRPLIKAGSSKTVLIDESYNTFLPLKDPVLNTVVGGINIGISQDQVFDKTWPILMTLVYIFIAFILVTLSLLYCITRRATKPLEILNRGALSLADGDLTTQVHVKATNEIGSLANSFNYMARELELDHKKLKEYSENLEKMVEERTAELKKSNLELDQSRQEIKSILVNIQHGVLTINRDQKINQEYSDYVHTLFGADRQVAGETLESLLIWEERRQKERDVIAEWLDLAFNEMMDWGMIISLGPALITHQIGGETRYYHNEFNRVMKDGKVEALMVIITDVTAEKRLEAAVEQQKKAYGREMEIISAIINQDRKEFENYLVESERMAKSAESLYEQLKEDESDRQCCNSLFRQMHSLKGNSRAYGMKELGELAHEAESILSGVREEEFSLSTELETGEIAAVKVEGCIEEIKILLEIGQDVFRKIAGEQERDLGKTRKQSRKLTIDEEDMDQILLDFDSLRRSEALRKNSHDLNLQELHWKLYRVKLERLDSVYNRLKNIVNDVAFACGKKATLEVDGDAIYLEHRVHGEVVNALIHMVRNSVDHGLEDPGLREAKGKEAMGTVRLETRQEKERVLIRLRDDGAGINPERILKKSLEKGLIEPEMIPTLSRDDILRLILLPGFSSAEKVSEISGRGVGMDVVLSTVSALGGTVEIESEIDYGTIFTMILPLSKSRETTIEKLPGSSYPEVLKYDELSS